mgnify:CR=1 FL=1
MKGTLSNLDNIKIKINQIRLKKIASVRVSPYSKEGETYANFSVHIGIDKRAIQLSPKQTKKLISALDEEILQWENARDKLGKVVEQWKKACLLGSAALWVKNFFVNLIDSGKATARSHAMRKALIPDVVEKGKPLTFSEGWIEWCSNKDNRRSLGKGDISATECLRIKSNDIENFISQSRLNKELYPAVINFLLTGNVYYEIIGGKFYLVPDSSRVYIDFDENLNPIRYIWEVPRNAGLEGAKQYQISYYGKKSWGKISIYGTELKNILHIKTGFNKIPIYGRSFLASVLNDVSILYEIEKSIGIKKENLCLACLTGEYPIKEKLRKIKLIS